MRDHPVIRQYTPQDFTQLLGLVTSLQDFFSQIDPDPKHHPFHSTEAAARYLLNALDDCQNYQGKCYVAQTVEGNIIGFISGIIIDHAEPDPYYDFTHEKTKEGAIGLLYVHPEHRGKGIGKALIKTVNQYYVSEACDSVQLLVSAHNLDTIAQYQHLGFEIVEHKMRAALS